ncbi:MAG: hypothetical protein WAV41_02960 [Microgenomates group bacterium]
MPTVTDILVIHSDLTQQVEKAAIDLSGWAQMIGEGSDVPSSLTETLDSKRQHLNELTILLQQFEARPVQL